MHKWRVVSCELRACLRRGRRRRRRSRERCRRCFNFEHPRRVFSMYADNYFFNRDFYLIFARLSFRLYNCRV
jgi:hypothetical protein